LISIEKNRDEACSNLKKKLAVFQLNTAIKIARHSYLMNATENIYEGAI
jgi:hypothetical protein